MVIPPQVAAAGIGAAASLIGGKRQRRAAKRQQAEMLKMQKEQQALLEKQKQEYRDIQFTNPYAGMENTYEDLTVNQQQAEFQAQQGQQQRANILGQLRGAAGTSGIAGLAQTLANQGQLQAQQISASIGQQEARNQQLAARGAAAVDLQIRTGDAMVQEAESGRQATLLGAQYGQAAGANEAYQQAVLNTQQASASARQMNADAFSDLAKSTKDMKWSDFTS